MPVFSCAQFTAPTPMLFKFKCTYVNRSHGHSHCANLLDLHPEVLIHSLAQILIYLLFFSTIDFIYS